VTQPRDRPVLWHLPVSHYSEKARWALDFKRFPHRRRVILPGGHMLVSGWLTRGQSKTFPVLDLGDRALGDSSAIIAELERRVAERSLYPVETAERARALDLEEYFDEELGPQIRLLMWHETRRDPQRMADLAEQMAPQALTGLPGSRAFARWFAANFVPARYRVAADSAAAGARVAVLAALDRLDAELEASGGEYLVGGSFSVADLTAAALFYPMVNPPNGPAMVKDYPPALEEFLAPLRERPAYAYVARMYREHR
jgi:glutathione S-transferase